MKEYDMQNTKNESLNFLRNNTKLGILATLKVMALKEQINKGREWYAKVEGELLDIDYSLAEELEYELRLLAWEKKCAKVWENSRSGMGLLEFTKMTLPVREISEQELIRKRTK